MGEMHFTILTIFPELFAPFWSHGMIGRAKKSGTIGAETIQIRDFTADRHRSTDDRPYGGGSGMVMTPEPLAAAIRQAQARSPHATTVLLSPQGRRFDQQLAVELHHRGRDMILVCGRYEGVDDRICGQFVDEEISVGDFVLTGGELAAMVIIDAVCRLIPGVLGAADAADKDSFASGLLEHPQFTRPRDFEGDRVPDILLSGNHAAVDRWRLEQSLMRTLLQRPDLLDERRLSGSETEILEKWRGRIDAILDSAGER
jgi:tRNA (guanine37-N1)-methyltransferase